MVTLVNSVVATAAVLGGMEPQQTDGDASSWIMRGANFIVSRSEVEPKSTLKRSSSPDEYFVYFVDVGGRVEAGPERLDVDPGTLVILPPGDSHIVAHGAGQIVRVFSSRSADLAALASNAEAYADGSGLASPLTDNPEPVGGYRVRTYRLVDFPTSRDNPMRLFRTRNLMLSIFPRANAARDVGKLTPHSHEDFEQGSLALEGEWIHHLRYPWGPELAAWKEDEHREMGSPSLLVIPPTVVHTSRNTSPGQLMDIFSPPRRDFAARAGWVRNEADYPIAVKPSS